LPKIEVGLTFAETVPDQHVIAYSITQILDGKFLPDAIDL
jgi:hypothetical protein